jgi:Putative Ig domain
VYWPHDIAAGRLLTVGIRAHCEPVPSGFGLRRHIARQGRLGFTVGIMMRFDNILRGAVVLLLAGLAACGGGDSGTGAGGSGGGSGGGNTNAAPTISGSPGTNVQAGVAYSFQPTAADPEGAVLSFSIQNKPGWATFSTSTGALAGTPAAGNVGTTSNIIISVSDGTNTTPLAAFALTVAAAPPSSTGTLRVDWSAPTQNTDGSTLSDLAGFRVYYGTSATAMTQSLNVPGASIRTATLSSLAPGTYLVSVTAYSTGGTESVMSNPASGTVN